MELVAKIAKVLPLEAGEGQRGPWARATVIVEYISGRYVNTLALECRTNKAGEFSKLPVGVEGKFFIEPTSREYNGKYYTSCSCFQWEVKAPVDDLPV